MKYTDLWLPGGKQDESPVTKTNSLYVPGFEFVLLSIIVQILAFPTDFLPSSAARLADCQTGREEVIAVTPCVTSLEKGPTRDGYGHSDLSASPDCVSPTISNSMIGSNIYYRIAEILSARFPWFLHWGSGPSRGKCCFCCQATALGTQHPAVCQ